MQHFRAPRTSWTRPVRPLLAGFLIAAQAPASSAADWYVDDDADCASAEGSVASPYCRIQDAISAASDSDTIHIAAGTYAESVTVDRDLVLIGTDGEAVTSIEGMARGLTVVAGVTANVQGFTIRGATGGVLVEPGAVTSMTRCTVGEQFLCCGSYGCLPEFTGAGIYNSGKLDLFECSVRDNVVSPFFPHLPTTGAAGIFNEGVLVASSSTITGNSCQESGAGLFNVGQATLTNCVIRDNIAVDPCPPCWGFVGGGIFSNDALTLVGCEVSGNVAFDGGGIAAYGATTLISCTVAGNWSGAYSGSSGVLVGGTATLTHTIVAENLGGDVCGSITSNGYNLFGDATCATISGPGTGDLFGIDPAFTNPNGPSFDWSLQASSPCIDVGDPSELAAGLDLVGTPRLLDGDLDGAMVLDIGAYELSNVRLTVVGDAAPGGALTFTLDGALPAGMVAVGLPGSALVPPYGEFFFDRPYARRLASGTLPLTGRLDIPTTLRTPFTLVLQGLGRESGVGNTSNPVVVTVE